MDNFALPRDSCMYSTRSMPHAEYPCDGAGRYPQLAMHCFMPTGYAGVYPHASSYPGMPHGYGYECGPLKMMPCAALGPPGLGFGCCPDSIVQPGAAMVGPSAAGDDGSIGGIPMNSVTGWQTIAREVPGRCPNTVLYPSSFDVRERVWFHCKELELEAVGLKTFIDESDNKQTKITKIQRHLAMARILKYYKLPLTDTGAQQFVETKVKAYEEDQRRINFHNFAKKLNSAEFENNKYGEWTDKQKVYVWDYLELMHREKLLEERRKSLEEEEEYLKLSSKTLKLNLRNPDKFVHGVHADDLTVLYSRIPQMQKDAEATQEKLNNMQGRIFSAHKSILKNLKQRQEVRQELDTLILVKNNLEYFLKLNVRRTEILILQQQVKNLGVQARRFYNKLHQQYRVTVNPTYDTYSLVSQIIGRSEQLSSHMTSRFNESKDGYFEALQEQTTIILLQKSGAWKVETIFRLYTFCTQHITDLWNAEEVEKYWDRTLEMYVNDFGDFLSALFYKILYPEQSVSAHKMDIMMEWKCSDNTQFFPWEPSGNKKNFSEHVRIFLLHDNKLNGEYKGDFKEYLTHIEYEPNFVNN